MRNILLGGVLAAASTLGVDACTVDTATIAKHPVPSNLDCQEDEAIYFDDSQPKVLGNDGRMGHPLGCVHINDIRPETEVSSHGPIEREVS